MKTVSFIRYSCHLLITLLILSLFSCSPDNSTYAGGGIGGTGVISTGTVTEIGSIWVNGIKYDTGNADIYVNGDFAGTGDQSIGNYLSPGTVVTVSGSVNPDPTGNADEVFYFSTLVGSIEGIVPVGADRIFTVLDQQAVITGETVIKGSNDFTEGNLVEISGLIDDYGRIQASFITKISDSALPDDLLRISGTVGSLDQENKTFFINGLEVDYEIAQLSGSSQDWLENDAWVHVSGYKASEDPIFTAEEIQTFDRIGQENGINVEFEGIAGTVLPENEFYMEGHTVQVRPQTKFTGGSREEIFAGTRIEVEGYFEQGLLIADHIKFKAGFMVESELAGKDPSNNTLTLRGLEDLVIATSALTRFNGIRKDFEELSVDDHLIIKGRIDENQTLIADQIISTPVGNAKVKIRGAVSKIESPYLYINTVLINTKDTKDTIAFFTEEELAVSWKTFLNLVEKGDIVDAQGELSADDSVLWDRIAISEP